MKTEKLKRKICSHYGNKIMDWCIRKYRFSKHQDFEPELAFKESNRYKWRGEYVAEDNEVIVYLRQTRGIAQLVRTIIHEYQHYMQSPVWYERYSKSGKRYDNHPYEIQANRIERRDWKECLDDILG